MAVLLLALTFALAFANGGNDNFKGVATLRACRAVSYWPALTLATIATALGVLASVAVGSALRATFSGQGLVPEAVAPAPAFLGSVAAGASMTVLIATRMGMPISTTHALAGALVGAGLAAAPGRLDWAGLLGLIGLPLALSPVLAIVWSGALVRVGRAARDRLLAVQLGGAGGDLCICADDEEILPDAGAGALARRSALRLTVAPDRECRLHGAGTRGSVTASALGQVVHALSAISISFARGLNDGPKIAALAVAGTALTASWGTLGVLMAMAAGGLIMARRVADTMSHELATVSRGEGAAGNLAAALLVLVASRFGMPVSTTHVTVGALVGIGAVNGSARWRMLGSVALAWVTTLPLGGLGGWLAYRLLAG